MPALFQRFTPTPQRDNMAKYDDAEFQLNREYSAPAPAAGNAGTTKFALYSAAILKKAVAVVKTAGTSSSSGSYLQVLVGTVTAGTLLTGSATAGTVISADLGSTPVPALTPIQILQGTDATGVVYSVDIQYTEQVS